MEELVLLSPGVMGICCCPSCACDICNNCIVDFQGCTTCSVAFSVNGENLEGSPLFDFQSGNSSHVFCTGGSTGTDLDVVPFGATVTVDCGTATTGSIESLLESELSTALGGSWSVSVIATGGGFQITNVTGTAITTQLTRIEVSDSPINNDSDITGTNTNHTLPCISDAANSSIFSGGATVTQSSNCTYTLTDNLACGGTVTATLVFAFGQILASVDIADGSGSIASASFGAAVGLPPYDCDISRNLPLLSSSSDQDPQGNDYVAWAGASVTIN